MKSIILVLVVSMALSITGLRVLNKRANNSQTDNIIFGLGQMLGLSPDVTAEVIQEYNGLSEGVYIFVFFSFFF